MKNYLKILIFSLSAILISPVTLLFLLLNKIHRSDSLFAGISQLLSLIPGKFGCYFRTGFYSFAVQTISQDAVISFLVLFSQQDTTIETGVYIGPQCNIGKCKISKNTLLGSGVHIMSGKQQHNFEDPKIPIKDQGGEFQSITIGEDCWIGNCSLIMANIGNKCIIGAGSVVINDIPDYSIVAGNPAKVIKTRSKD